MLRAERNKISKQIRALMGQGKCGRGAEEIKKQVAASQYVLMKFPAREREKKVLKDMMVIPRSLILQYRWKR